MAYRWQVSQQILVHCGDENGGPPAPTFKEVVAPTAADAITVAFPHFDSMSAKERATSSMCVCVRYLGEEAEA